MGSSGEGVSKKATLALCDYFVFLYIENVIFMMCKILSICMILTSQKL